MMIKFTVVLTTLFLAMTGINADNIRGLQNQNGRPGGGGGRPGGGGGRPGGGGGGRPGGGGGGGVGRPGGGGGDRGNGSQRPGSGGERPELVDLACSNDAAAEEPECALRNGELGNWLCRTIVDPLTLDSDSWSTCGNATRALPSDACGCCDGDCPEECACGCPIEGVADAGVLVTMTRKSGEANEKCLAPEKAISLIAKPGDRVQCATECPVVEVP
jgi:hypothetical protein